MSKASNTLRAPIVRLSLVLFLLAWIIVFAAAGTRTPNSERSLAMIVAGFGWPVVYAFCLSMAWLATCVAATTEPIGPGKELQGTGVKSLFVPWCNVSIILLPSAVAVVGLLGLIGVLPTS